MESTTEQLSSQLNTNYLYTVMLMSTSVNCNARNTLHYTEVISDGCKLVNNNMSYLWQKNVFIVEYYLN